MLKRSCSLSALIAALTLLVAVSARSQSLPTSTSRATPPSFSAPLPNAITPVCYIQLENGQLRDLGRLCGQKSTSPAPSSSIRRSVSQSDPDSDDDDSTPTATSRPQRTPLQPSSASTPLSQPFTNTIRQPAAIPLPNSTGRATNVQSSSAPSVSTPSLPNPLTIPEDDSR